MKTPKTTVTWGKTRVHLLLGDITEEEADAVVNAAFSCPQPLNCRRKMII